MKRNRLFVIWSLFVAMTLSLAACGGDTVNPFDATITSSVEQGVAPLAVDFTATVNTGNEPYTFAWDFGDGGTSGEQDPSHTYNTAGEYAVTVSIEDAKDRSIERSLTILVIDSLAIEMAVEPTDGMAPLLVEVSSLATGGMPPYAYAWNFGDGGSSDQASASHLYAMAGTFDLSLTVTDSQGAIVTDTATVQVNDDHVPVAAIRANPTVGVAPLDVGFFGSAVGGDAPLSYSWHFGDGENSAEQNPSHTFVEAGVYTVILQVEDADGDTGQATVEVQVASNEVPAVEIGASPIEGIEPLDVQFVANAAGGNVPLTFVWDFDADGVTDSMQMTPMHTFAAGSHEVSLTVTDVDGDTATDTVTIEVDTDTEPEVTVAADPASGQAPLTVGFTCSATGVNLPYTYNWDFGNGQMSNLQNPTYTYAEAGLYTAACSVTDADGDFAVGTVEVQVDADLAPQVTIQADPLVGIANLDVAFHAEVVGGDAPFTYSWNLGEGTLAFTQDYDHTYTASGTFTVVVVVTDADGDTATDSVDISVATDDAPAVEISATPMQGIAPLEVQFVANTAGGNAPLTYAWDFDGDAAVDSTLANPNFVFTAGSHDVSVTVTDADGDEASDTVTIEVEADTAPVATVAASPDQGRAPLMVAFGCAVTGGNEPLTYAWNFGNGQTSNLQAPSYTYTEAGLFTAVCTVTDADGDVDSDSVAVDVAEANIAPVIDSMVVDNGYGVPIPLTCGLVGNTMFEFQVVAHDGNTPEDPLTYEWTFDVVPAGSTAAFNNANVSNPTFVPDRAGAYVVRVFVRDGRGGVASSVMNLDAQLPSLVSVVSPIPAPPGIAGDNYPEELDVMVSTACGIPVAGVMLEWSSSNGQVFDTWSSNENGLAGAQVRLGCEVGTASFTAEFEGAVAPAVFDISVLVGPPVMLTVTPETDVPLTLEATPTIPNAMLVTIALADQCGNPTTGDEVTFDVDVMGDDACFGAPCSQGGEMHLSSQVTVGGMATLEVYSTRVTDVDVWVHPYEPMQVVGPVAFYHSDFEGSNGGIWSDGMMMNDWAWGMPENGAHSGSMAWDTNPEGDYAPWEGEDMRYLVLSQCLPFTGMPTTVSFWSKYDLAAGAIANVWAFGEQMDTDSPYDSSLNGWAGWGGTADWHQVTLQQDFDGQCFDLYFSLYLYDATETAAGWTIDDMRIDGWQEGGGRGNFVAGAPWGGHIMSMHNGVEACATSPAMVQIGGSDIYGNGASGEEMLVTAACANADFSMADGFVRTEGANGAWITLNSSGWRDVRFVCDTAGDPIIVTLSLPSGDQTAGVTFYSTGSEVCDDGLDNDCNGEVDCADDACGADPYCTPDLVPQSLWVNYDRDMCELRFQVEICNQGGVEFFNCVDVGIYRNLMAEPPPGPPVTPEAPYFMSMVCAPESLMPGQCVGADLEPFWDCQPSQIIDFYAVLDPNWMLMEEIEKGNNVSQVGVLDLRPIESASASMNCLDNFDNDGDGLIDCEDMDDPILGDPCRQLGMNMCDNDAPRRLVMFAMMNWGVPNFDVETCNGVDDVGIGAIDLYACSCVSDNGCDDLDPSFPYRCFTELSDVGMDPVCGVVCEMAGINPDEFCQELTWGQLPFCQAGRCVAEMEPVCGDGFCEWPEEDDPDSYCADDCCNNGICSEFESESGWCPGDCSGGEQPNLRAYNAEVMEHNPGEMYFEVGFHVGNESPVEVNGCFTVSIMLFDTEAGNVSVWDELPEICDVPPGWDYQDQYRLYYPEDLVGMHSVVVYIDSREIIEETEEGDNTYLDPMMYPLP